MTKSLQKPRFKLSEAAANTWGIVPCAELGRSVAYFEIAPTLGLKPVQIYILFIGVTTGCLRLFSYHILCCNELERE
jgi:hypothetical protein